MPVHDISIEVIVQQQFKLSSYARKPQWITSVLCCSVHPQSLLLLELQLLWLFSWVAWYILRKRRRK